ncbi:MAG: hypothetical protein IPO42_16485 [Chitinophagaceae bacterium]|nr:hypothetical protein [Chitinophagaceae bacterium]
MSIHERNKLFEGALVKEALKQSFVKLDPRIQFRNQLCSPWRSAHSS